MGKGPSGVPDTNQQQFARLLDIVRAASDSGAGHCSFTVGEFCYRWQTETKASERALVRVWDGDGSGGRGFAWLSGDHLHLVTLADGASLHEEMLEWGEAVGRNTCGIRALRVPIADHSTSWQRGLARNGYQPGEPVLVRRSRQLESIADPLAIPSGYSVAPVSTAADLEGWASAYREAFVPEAMTTDLRRRVSDSPLYRSELDLIARNPDGEVAAFALVWFDGSDTGTFEPLGCRPADQRQGRSQALMIEGLRSLKQLGASRAYVGTTESRLAANRLYQSLGFQVNMTCRVWRTVG